VRVDEHDVQKLPGGQVERGFEEAGQEVGVSGNPEQQLEHQVVAGREEGAGHPEFS
jgi:hypothetical protein